MTAVNRYGYEPSDRNLKAAMRTARNFRFALQPAVDRLGIELEAAPLEPSLAQAIASQDHDDVALQLQNQGKFLSTLPPLRLFGGANANVTESATIAFVAQEAGMIEMALVEVWRTSHNLDRAPTNTAGTQEIGSPVPINLDALYDPFDNLTRAISLYGRKPSNVTLKAAADTARRLGAALQHEVKSRDIEPRETTISPHVARAIQSKDPKEIADELRLEQSSVRYLLFQQLADANGDVTNSSVLALVAHQVSAVEKALLEVGRTVHNLDLAPSNAGISAEIG